MRIFLRLLGVFLIIVGCNKKNYSVTNLPEAYIIAGSSGGFTGVTSQIFLLPNGDRYRIEGFGDTTTINPLPKKTLRNMVKLQKDSLQSFDVNTKGNMNYFVEFHSKKINKTYHWTHFDEVPLPLRKIYLTVISQKQ